jgi:AraC-like DNA-binding protein
MPATSEAEYLSHMLSTVVFFITATLGFVCLASIYGESKRDNRSLINKYLTVIIAFQAVRFTVYGFAQGYPGEVIGQFTNLLDVCAVALMPCFFLYFRDIVHEKAFEAGNMVHFLAPVLLACIYLAKQFVGSDIGVIIRKSFLISSIMFYGLYAFSGFKLLIKHVWRRKSEINTIQKQNQLIRNWTIILYVSFIAIFLIRVTTGFLIHEDYRYDTHYLWITALIWVGIFLKILLTPEILYGYNFLNKTIDTVTEKLALHTVWKVDGTATPITIEKDRKIEEKLSSSLNVYIHTIEDLSFHKHAFRNPAFGLEDIAAAINIPFSHVHHIFKFHCTESFTDYKKIVRIHDATKLLENRYLEEKTIESLSETVGFSSYVTFYLAFKSITGMSTQEYAKKFKFGMSTRLV